MAEIQNRRERAEVVKPTAGIGLPAWPKLLGKIGGSTCPKSKTETARPKQARLCSKRVEPITARSEADALGPDLATLRMERDEPQRL